MTERQSHPGVTLARLFSWNFGPEPDVRIVSDGNETITGELAQRGPDLGLRNISVEYRKVLDLAVVLQNEVLVNLHRIHPESAAGRPILRIAEYKCQEGESPGRGVLPGAEMTGSLGESASSLCALARLIVEAATGGDSDWRFSRLEPRPRQTPAEHVALPPKCDSARPDQRSSSPLALGPLRGVEAPPDRRPVDVIGGALAHALGPPASGASIRRTCSSVSLAFAAELTFRGTWGKERCSK
jgi:hypothetical protein